MSKMYKKIKFIYYIIMIWQILVIILIFILIIPIPIKFKVLFNILRLSGEVQVNVFRFMNYKIKVKFKGQYVYVTKKNKTYREKLSSKNFNVAFVLQMIRQLYFRLVLDRLIFVSENGYYNDAMITAVSTGVIDVISKCVYAKILHNKKSAHILINNEAKYNQDCLNFKIEGKVNISIFDIFYSVINSLWSLKGEKYETTDSKAK